MSTVSSFPKSQRGPSMRQIQVARRRMARARDLDRLAWRYRHLLRVLQALGATTLALGGIEAAARLIGA